MTRWVLRWLLSAVSVCIAAGALAGVARADRAFQPRFVADADGGLAQAANTLETCPASAAGCVAAREGIGSLLDNNDFAMQYVDVDDDPATFDSSSARLALPAGARVLFAALYVGGRTEVGTRGQRTRDASPNALAAVLIRAPGEDSYTRLGPAGATLDQSTSVRGAYQAVHDVTDLVRRAGAGVYTVADVQAATGVDRYAGWALEVAYAAAGDPPRNLSIFDGLQSVTRGQPPLTIPLSGFTTPLQGPVRTQVGVVAYEGDLGSGGDSMALDGHVLSDPADPASDFFDSGISISGVPSTEKMPDYRNQLGFDAKLVSADGALPNAATSGQITLTTSLEQYLPGAVAFATDLYAPDLRATKTVENVTRPGEAARPGDRLRYTIIYRNDGQATAQDVIASDQIPDGVTLMPGSLRSTSADPETLTDSPGDDTGEYDPLTRTVRVLIGQGATPERGGEIAPAPALGDQAMVTFNVEVDPTQHPERVSNSASATVSAPSLTQPLQVISNPVDIDVQPTEQPVAVADLSVSEQQTDSESDDRSETTDTITITDRGPADATNVHTQIDLAPGETVGSIRAPDASCAPDGRGAHCVTGHLDAGASTQIDIVEDDMSARAMVAPTEVTTVADQLDETVADNAAITPTVPASPSLPAGDDATLTTTIRPALQTVRGGGQVVETVLVHNQGPGDAEPVVVSAAASLPVSAVRASAPGTRCETHPVIRCSTAQLRAGDTLRVRIRARPTRPGRLVWTVDASSDRFNAHPGQQTAMATVDVRTPAPALALSLHAAPDTIVPGQPAMVLLRVRNPLSSPVRNVAACLRVPAPLIILSPATPSAGSSRERCWASSTLQDGHAEELAVRVTARTPPASHRVTLVATASARPTATVRASIGLTILPGFTGCAAAGSMPTLRADC